ncbi:MAG: phage terminase large subunit [Acetobacter papayae]|uniref:PBSX family phage terminase large subunit n=1 Tax=Acetobacter papayae TaxID=1076592 RepID=UPI0039EBF5A3
MKDRRLQRALRALDMPTARVFAPLLGPCRYKGAYGGRGSGKSHFFGECVVEEHLRLPGHRSVCIREVQRSMEQSSRRLILDKIAQHGLEPWFDVQDRAIRTPGDGLIIFQGMQSHTADSIKSLEGFDRAWVEEAQNLSALSWRLLRPTLRKKDSEIWASWNLVFEHDPVDMFFRGAGSERADLVAVRANWADNPWFGEGALPREREADVATRPDDYAHVWEGAYRTRSDALVFSGMVEVRAFSTPENIRPYYGVDWGFSKDPLAALRCWVAQDVLYIDYEAGGVGIELDAIPAVLDTVPGARQWPWRADGARPETISFLARRHGFRITAARKWPGSVEDGIARLRAFRRIVVHPRCVRVVAEFHSYAYRVDPGTEDVLPVVEDANNHWMDALRYALDGLIHNRRTLPRFTAGTVRQIMKMD